MRALASMLLVGALLVVPATVSAQGYDATNPANFAWVEKGVLAVGGGGLNESEVSWLAAQRFGAIADFRSEHADPKDAIAAAGMDYLYIPVDHGADLDATQLQQFLSWADAEAAAGKPMYIHCTNGWHRAGAFAITWRAHREHVSIDQAAKEEIAARPGSVMRAPGALLHWAAAGAPALDVFLESPAARPPDGGSIPVTVEVLHAGAPVAGASVHFWTESGRVDLNGVTDANGKAVFDYAAPPAGTFMDFLYARASAAGYLDGADQAEAFYGISVAGAGTLGLTVNAAPDGLRVHIDKQGPLHARIIAWTADGWSVYRSTPATDVTLPAPPQGGDVKLRVESWGGTGASASVHVAGAPAAPTPAPSPAPPPAPAPTPAPVASPTPATPAPPSASPPAPSENERAAHRGSGVPVSAPAASDAPSAPATPHSDSASGPSLWLYAALGCAALAATAGVYVLLRVARRRSARAGREL